LEVMERENEPGLNKGKVQTKQKCEAQTFHKTKLSSVVEKKKLEPSI